jgi:hypothetical protein
LPTEASRYDVRHGREWHCGPATQQPGGLGECGGADTLRVRCHAGNDARGLARLCDARPAGAGQPDFSLRRVRHGRRIEEAEVQRVAFGVDALADDGVGDLSQKRWYWCCRCYTELFARGSRCKIDGDV